MSGNVALSLFGHFAGLSLLMIGGGVVLIPEIHRLLVAELHLLSDASFTGAVAIAQAAPGPNVLFIAVLGYRAAGVWGALATMLGAMLPAATLVFLGTRWLRVKQHLPAVRAFKLGMAPLVIAMMCATGWTLTMQTPGSRHVLVTLAAAGLVWKTRLHLLWLIGAGAALGALGWI
jgi:chromate transporter